MDRREKNIGTLPTNYKRTRGAGVFGLLALLLCALLLSGCGAGADPTTKEDGPKAHKVGEWITLSRTAAADGEEHKVRLRVTAIERDPAKAKERIEAFNSSAAGSMIDTGSAGDGLSFCVASYEVEYPEEYPAEDFGITDPALPFSVTGTDGGPLVRDDTQYEGLSSTVEMGPPSQGYDFYPGQTYEGEIAFLMIENDTGYLLCCAPEVDGKPRPVYIKGE